MNCSHVTVTTHTTERKYIMSNLTLEQVGILEALAIAETACKEAREMIGCKPSKWEVGRAEGAMLERLEQCQQNLSATQIGLTVRMHWV